MKKVIGFEGNIINKSIGKGNPTMFLQTDLLKLREEMIELAKISGGQFGVAEVNVEEFPLVPKI